MVKVFGIFRNIKDMDKFLEFYKDMVPRINQLPGIITSELIQVSQLSAEVDPAVEGIQMILDTHYESEEAIGAVLGSPEGIDIMRSIEESDLAELSVYRGDTKGFNMNSTTVLRVNTLIDMLDSVEATASSVLIGEQKQGALQAIQLLRREVINRLESDAQK